MHGLGRRGASAVPACAPGRRAPEDGARGDVLSASSAPIDRVKKVPIYARACRPPLARRFPATARSRSTASAPRATRSSARGRGMKGRSCSSRSTPSLSPLRRSGGVTFLGDRVDWRVLHAGPRFALIGVWKRSMRAQLDNGGSHFCSHARRAPVATRPRRRSHGELKIRALRRSRRRAGARFGLPVSSGKIPCCCWNATIVRCRLRRARLS